MPTVAELDAQIAKLTAERNRLQHVADKNASIEFIRVNQITRDKVQMSSGQGVPWYGTLAEFGRWCRDRSDRNWAEWNGRLHHMSDIIKGRMSDLPGKLEDVS